MDNDVQGGWERWQQLKQRRCGGRSMSAKRSGPQPLNATEQALMDAHRTIGELEADKYALEQRAERLNDLYQAVLRDEDYRIDAAIAALAVEEEA